jgi:CHAT domain-containing protein
MPSRGVGTSVCLAVLFGGAGFFLNLLYRMPLPASGSELRLTEIATAPAVSPKKRRRQLPWEPQNVLRRLPRGEVHRYAFQLKADQILEAVVEQGPVRGQEIDVAVQLYTPDGNLVYEINNPTNATRAEKIFLLAKSPGEYSVDVDGGEAEGFYRLGHIVIHKANEKDRINAQAEELFYRARAQMQRRPPEVDAALRDYEQAGVLWHCIGNKQREADELDRRITILTLTGRIDLEKLLNLQTMAKRFFHEAGDYDFELKMLIACGVSQRSLGRISEAEKSFRKVLSEARKKGYHEHEADALKKLASIYEHKGQKYEALKCYEKSLPFWQKQRRLHEQVELLTLIGLIYQSLGDYRLAEERFVQAGRLLEIQDDVALKGVILTRLADVNERMGKLETALTYALQALDARRRARDIRGEAISLGEIGLIYRGMNDFARARGYLENEVTVLQRLKDGRNEALARYNLGLVLLDEGNVASATEQFERSVALSRAQSYPEGELTALYGLAQAQARGGNPLRARAIAEEAVKLSETVPRGTGNEGHKATADAAREGAHELLIQLLVASDASYTSPADRSRSFEVSEMSRGRTLLDSLSSEQVGSGWLKGADLELRGRYEDVKKTMARNDEQLKRLPSESSARKELLARQAELHEESMILEARLRASSPWQDTARPAPVTLKTAQEMLDQDAVLLEYFLGRRRSLLWLVTATSETLIELPPRETIEHQALQFYDSLKGSRKPGGQQRAAKAARDLGQLLLGPVGDLLNKYKHIIVVRDGALHYVPFSILPDPASAAVGDKRSAWPKPLLTQHDVTYLPSMSVLHAIREVSSRRRPATRSLAIFASPVFPPGEHKALPFSAQEADKVRALLSPQGRPLVVRGYQATRALALSGVLKDFRCLLFATHGQSHPEQPNLSGITLSQLDTSGRPIEGELRMQDIKSLDLKAELVVLSACNTAPGTEIHGEGFVGLTQGFMYAGASRVIVSLWNVNDQAAPELIERLFRGILKDHLSPSESLRQAQLWMFRQGKAPYYWGGFEIHGDYRSPATLIEGRLSPK